MNPLSIQMDEEARRMAKVLAEKWGLPEQRFLSRVLLRCLERVYQQEIGSEQVNAADEEGRRENLVANVKSGCAALPRR